MTRSEFHTLLNRWRDAECVASAAQTVADELHMEILKEVERTHP